MEKLASPLAQILYHLLLAALGILSIFVLGVGYLFDTVFYSLLVIGVVGLIYYLTVELLESGGFLYVFFGVIRRIIVVAAFALSALIFFTGYAQSDFFELFEKVTFGAAFAHAIPYTAIVYILLRPIVYSFTLDNLSEEGVGLVNMLLPFITYLISVVLVLISSLWCFVALLVIWFFTTLFIKGTLNRVEYFFLSAAFYLSCFVCGMMMIETLNLVVVFSLLAMASCFFYYVGIDLCRDTDVPYWIFNILGALSVIVFTIMTVAFADESGLEGMKAGISFGFVDALKNAIYFTPLVYALIRPAVMKLSVESDWENGLDEVFTTMIVFVVSFVITVIMLLIGFAYVIGVIALIVLIPMLYCGFTDYYPTISEYTTEIRDARDGYIHSIVIIE